MENVVCVIEKLIIIVKFHLLEYFIGNITKSNNADLTKAGISLSEGLKLLHSIDSNGKLHVGVDSFILIWKQLNRWRILAFVVSLPPIRQIADILYKIFA